MDETLYQTLDAKSAHRVHDWVTVGDTLRPIDRSAWLTVTGFHERSRRKRRRASYFDTVELVGNGTEYHLLCWDEEGDIGPMLYKVREWEKTGEDAVNDYTYPRGGERVEGIEVGVRYAVSPLDGAYLRVTEWDEPKPGKLVASAKEEISEDEVPAGWLELLQEEADAAE